MSKTVNRRHTASDSQALASMWTRRQFLRTTVATAAGITFWPALGTKAPSDQISPGYTLVSPMFTGQTVLINNDQKVVHSWNLKHLSGGTAHLLPDGTLLQSGIIDHSDSFPGAIRTGGLGYTSIYNWAGDLIWDYYLHTEKQLSHHAIKPMPNGNVMLIVYERFLTKDALAAGRDPALLPKDHDEVWSEALLEVDPKTNKIVWEWHLWDHLVQDAAPKMANYGDPAKHPELVDLNYAPPFPNYQPTYGIATDWIHANAVDYNPHLDQLLFNARELSEIWVIDHSTTTAEAASHKGGRYGKGGDLLYRWGNPAAYRAGTKSDQILWFHHGSRWIEDGLPGAGNILIFDDGTYVARNTSRAIEITPEINSNGSYNLSAGKPTAASIAWQYSIDPADFAFIMGAVQRLPNGNTLVTNGYKKKVLEVTRAGQIVWTLTSTDYLFTVDRFLPDYPAFSGKTLT